MRFHADECERCGEEVERTRWSEERHLFVCPACAAVPFDGRELTEEPSPERRFGFVAVLAEPDPAEPDFYVEREVPMALRWQGGTTRAWMRGQAFRHAQRVHGAAVLRVVSEY